MEFKNICSAIVVSSVLVGGTITSFNASASEVSNQAQEVKSTAKNITSVEKLGNGKIVLNFDEQTESLNPEVFDLSGRTKLVVDFVGIKNATGKKAYGIADDDFINKVSVVEVQGRTRVVFEFKQKVNFNIDKKSKSLMVSVNKFEDTNPVIAKIDSQKNEVENVKSINQEFGNKTLDRLHFTRGSGKIGKLTLEVSDKNFVPTITKTGSLLSIDLGSVKVPESMQKRLEVATLNTSVLNIDVVTQKQNTKINLNVKDKWDFVSYQTDNKLVIEVKTMSEYDEIVKNEKDKASFKGKPVTLNFQDIEVRSVLQVLGDFTGLNIISSDKITSKMTLRLKDVPWDQALRLILESNNLEQVKDGNIIWIATRQEVVDKQEMQKKQKEQEIQIKPLKMEIFQLNHHKAEKIFKMIKGQASSGSGGSAASSASSGSSSNLSFLSVRGKASFDDRSNVLIIEDVEERIEEIRKLVSKLDQNVRQVLVEAKIVIADDKYSRDLGAKLGVMGGRNVGNTGIGLASTNSASQAWTSGVKPFLYGNTITTDSTTGLSSITTNTIPYNSSFPAASGAASIAFSFLNLKNGNLLNLELSAMEKNNRGRVVSSPRLMTTDNHKAVIEQGSEVPYVTPGSANSPATVSFKKAVLSLGVTPQIAPNGRIIMDLDIRKDSIGEYVSTGTGTSVPSIDTKNIQTQVTVNDGQTVVLGGVVENIGRNDIQKVPFLGDVPIVGNFFKNTLKTENKAEVLIFLTPYVITDDIMDVAAMDDSSPMEFELKDKKEKEVK